MTDKEIVKALECCLKDDCDHCPNDFGNCYANLARYSLSIINRQKETIEQLKTALFKCGEDAVEIANYKKIAEYQQSLSMDRGFEIKRLKEEIERLKAPRYVAIPKPSNKYKSEISPLVYTEEFTLKRIDEEGIRAEAVKEFAERLKKEVDGWYYDFANIDDTMDALTDIDNLVKEFTEGG